jgi:hypothetical protein
MQPYRQFIFGQIDPGKTQCGKTSAGRGLLLLMASELMSYSREYFSSKYKQYLSQN